MNIEKILMGCVPIFLLASLSYADASQVVRTTDSPTILRSGPSEDYDRIVELPKGLFLQLESTQKEWSKVRLSSVMSGWILTKSLKETPHASSHPVLKHIKIKTEKDDVRMEILESEPGVLLTEEWLRPPVLWLRFQNSQSALSEIDYGPKDPLILHVSVRQESEDVVALRIDLKALQGFQLIQKDPEHLLIKFKQKEPGQTQTLKGWTICLDPGHGGNDKGATGPTGLNEKQIALEISKLLAKLLESKGAHVVLTRSTDESLADPNALPEVELEKRVDVARDQDANLFVSIHCNARPTVAEGRTARGSYVYYYQPQSFALARAVSEDLERQIWEPKYGVVFRSFHVIRQPDLPAILVETAFISNPVTEAKLRTKTYQKKIARGIFKGIVDYAKSL